MQYYTKQGKFTLNKLILNKKYMGETCGLCGNYNSKPNDDRMRDGITLDPLVFGDLNKVQKPKEICENVKEEFSQKCYIYRADCLKHLLNIKWRNCNKLVKPDPFVDAYMMDMCLCKGSEKMSSFCLCSTMAEYSRQCALVGGKPPDWRSPTFCYKKCPDNLIYKECSPPCTASCSNPGRQYFCDGPCLAKCTCPEGKFSECNNIAMYLKFLYTLTKPSQLTCPCSSTGYLHFPTILPHLDNL
ncbi:mucin-6-like [Pyxicephalus adspersus]|uniref:mucin-6-like n=1 Tax=Pyxicephalus adspersus TaxID=30357 RepID=UPI003B5BFE37